MTGSQPQAPVRPVVTIPGYKITGVLGKGGMAIVYLAIQESIGRQVALKILAPDHSDDSFTDRFLREARIISQLAHPHIITIYDAGVHQSYHYMCMEYVPGKNLTQARDNLSRKQKVAIIKQIAMALDYASKKGYVHRDIKPENIMLHEDGRAILTDFGIARGQDVTRGLTQTGKAIGTPYFMSPEQTKGMRVDHRSDIYSLGVVLFQALSGHVPYDGSSIVAIGIKHISEPIPSLPPGMEIFQPIINKCMSKDPAHRYQNAGELHQALEDISEAQLDYIDAKAKALRQSGGNPYAKTQLEQASIEILANSAASPAVRVAPAIPKIRAQRSDTRIDITETEEFRRLARRRRRWLLLVLLVTLAAAAYYQQDRLLNLWQTKLQARVEPYLPQNWHREKPHQPTTGGPAQPPPVKPAPILQQPAAAPAQNEKTTQDVIADVQLYKDKLRINPDDSAARAGLTQAREWFHDKLEKALTNKDSDEARHLLAVFRRSFPRLQKLPIYARIENRIQAIDNFNAHLEQARVFMAANAVAKPDGANALEEYLAASRIDSDAPAVKQGLQDIADYYYKKAKTAKAEGNLVSAIDSVTIGLQAVANDGPLLALKHELNNAAQQQEQIKQMLQEATKLMSSDQVIDPPERNALQLYRAILQVSPNEQDAINGLQQVQLWLQSRIQTLHDKKQYLPARKLAQRAHAAFPTNSLITELQKKIDKAIADTYPRISRIAFSTTPVNSLDKDSLDNLAPGQTLYAGFEFRNFYDANTQLVARLMNGNDQTQYDEQTVNVSGRDGQGRFALKLPKPGSPNGNYIVELYMNNARILKARLSGLH